MCCLNSRLGRRLPPAGSSSRSRVPEAQYGRYHLNVYCENTDSDAYNANPAQWQWYTDLVCDCSCYANDYGWPGYQCITNANEGSSVSGCSVGIYNYVGSECGDDPVCYSDDTPCCGGNEGYSGTVTSVDADADGWINLDNLGYNWGIDFFRVYGGCGLETSSSWNGVNTFTGSVSFCNGQSCGMNSDGTAMDDCRDYDLCDAVSSIRLVGTTGTTTVYSTSAGSDYRCSSEGCTQRSGLYCYDGGDDQYGCETADDEAGSCCPVPSPPPTVSPVPTLTLAGIPAPTVSAAPTPHPWYRGEISCGARIEDDTTDGVQISGHGENTYYNYYSSGDDANLHEHFFSFKPEGWGYVRFSTCGSQFNTYLNIYENVTGSTNDCSPAEYTGDYQAAYDFCVEHGMRQIASRDDYTGNYDRCVYNSDASDVDLRTHGCCAADIDWYMRGDRTYWISVTGKRGGRARARPRNSRARFL